MDDFNLQNLNESRNEWVARLITMLAPSIFQGLKQIFDDAVKLSVSTNQKDKYLMTFQNMLTQIPKWNNDIIETETERIKESTHCNYIEDLITCVHVIQLKALTCVRVSQNEKDVEINIPKLPDFIHRVYINTARVIYSNIYLFEQEIMPVQIQQNYNKVDQIIKENIIQTIRQSMPIEELLRAYLEETVSKALDGKAGKPNVSNISDQSAMDSSQTTNETKSFDNAVAENGSTFDEAVGAAPDMSSVSSPQTDLEEIQISANDALFEAPVPNESPLSEYEPFKEDNALKSLETSGASETLSSPTDTIEDDVLKEQSVTFSGIPDDDSFVINHEDIISNDNDTLLGIETLA